MAILIPAILTRDPEEIYEKIRFLESIPEITHVHLDFADGQLVPNTSVLPRELAAFETRLHLEAHLMVRRPQNYFHELERLGVGTAICHFESFLNIEELVTAIANLKALGLAPGVVINPVTDVTVFDNFISGIEVAMLMCIVPGFQGQKFMPKSLPRLEILHRARSGAIIEVDGGIKLSNIGSLVAHGAERLVVGSGIWQCPDPKQRIYEFLNKLK